MLIGYRCKVCGAPIDPETGYCKYCDTLNFNPIVDKPLINEKPRIIVRHENEEAEIEPLELSLSLERTPMIDVTMLEDTTRRYIAGFADNQYARFSVKSYAKMDAINILRQPSFDVVSTGFRKGYGHEFLAYTDNVGLSFFGGKDIINYFDIVSVKPVDLWNTRRIHNQILEGMRCPICGADLGPEKSKCDYCGYWWIYSPEG